MPKTTLAVAVLALVPVLPGQGGLEVKADPDNCVAAHLEGSWQVDKELTRRLGGNENADDVTFRVDPGVLAKVPAQMLPDLRREFRALSPMLAGMMVAGKQESVFFLTPDHGNVALVWLRDKAGKAMADYEGTMVTIVAGRDRAADVLFFDRGKTAYTRAAPAAAAAAAAVRGAATVPAALAEIARLLEKKDYQTLIETFALPDELKSVQQTGIAKIAEGYGRNRADELKAAVTKAATMEPKYNDDRTEAVFDGEGFDRALRFLQADGRWYLR
jgi:hypothetical protein